MPFAWSAEVALYEAAVEYGALLEVGDILAQPYSDGLGELEGGMADSRARERTVGYFGGPRSGRQAFENVK